MRRSLLFLLLAAAPVLARAELDFTKLNGLTASLMKVEAMNGDGSVSLGTGVVVAPGIIVTNCHVTRGARSIEVVKGALHHAVESQDSDMAHDLCLLKAPQAEDQPVVRLREERPRVGEDVYAIGYILGVSPRFNLGQVNALYNYDGGRVIQSSTPFSSGASGGGLFDEQGRLVGIVTFKSRGGFSYHFSLPVSWVTDAVKRYRGRPVRPLTGTPFWQRPRDSQPFFLRAASLEGENRWWDLADLARLWSKAEPGNPSSWFTLGKAHQHLRQHELSIDAYRRAIALDPNYAEAWYQIALAYIGNHNAAQASDAQRVVQDLDPRLAADLARASRECDEVTAIC